MSDDHLSCILGTESEQEDEDDEEEDDDLLLILVADALRKRKRSTRSSFVVNKRLDWARHVNILHLRNVNEFVILYRMTYRSFMKLCDILDPLVKVNRIMSTRRTSTEPIDTMTIVGSTLRWLSGTDYRAVCGQMGICKATFYRITRKCMKAMLQSKELAITVLDWGQCVGSSSQATHPR